MVHGSAVALTAQAWTGHLFSYLEQPFPGSLTTMSFHTVNSNMTEFDRYVRATSLSTANFTVSDSIT